MTSEIPSHHIKQNVCGTRPPYRDGRQPKAVKVYTVNNESCYILIQGVPSVGASQELHKLCSSFGNVGQFNALDDYPSEDKYIEAYLVKYSKIQSARFAKRKLDDHSFFGGTLHVCYAPEYESVTETREKLQDRRRVIATRIRQFAENTGKQLALPSNTQHHTVHSADKYVNSSVSQLFRQEEQNFPAQRQRYQLETSATFPVPGQLDRTAISQQSASTLPAISQQSASTLPAISQQSASTLPAIADKITIQSTFELLPPPKSDLAHFHKGNKNNAYEFSRVRSAHATLPPGYDARLMPPISNKSVHPENNSSRVLHLPHGDIPQRGETKLLPSSESPSPSVHSSSVIVRDYKPSKPSPRFVPRQAVKNKPEKSEPGSHFKKHTDLLDQEIRKNAFRLGETQGPALVPQRKRVLSTPAQQSVNETINDIRNKISKVITQSVMKQNDVTGKS